MKPVRLVGPRRWSKGTGETVGVGPAVHEKEYSRDQGYLEGRASLQTGLQRPVQPRQLERGIQSSDEDWIR